MRSWPDDDIPVPLIIIGGLTSTGVYLLLERNLTRMLWGCC